MQSCYSRGDTAGDQTQLPTFVLALWYIELMLICYQGGILADFYLSGWKKLEVLILIS